MNYDRRPPPAYEQIRVLEDMNLKLEAEVAEERRLKWFFLRYFASDRNCSHEEALDFAKRNLKEE